MRMLDTDDIANRKGRFTEGWGSITLSAMLGLILMPSLLSLTLASHNYSASVSKDESEVHIHQHHLMVANDISYQGGTKLHLP